MHGNVAVAPVPLAASAPAAQPFPLVRTLTPDLIDKSTQSAATAARGRLRDLSDFPTLPSQLAQFLHRLDHHSSATEPMETCRLWCTEIRTYLRSLKPAYESARGLAGHSHLHELETVQLQAEGLHAAAEHFEELATQDLMRAGTDRNVDVALTLLASAECVTSSLSTVIDALFDDLQKSCDATDSSQISMNAQEESRAQAFRSRIAELLQRLFIVQQELHDLQVLFRAESSGTVVIEGPWGTGKSFHLGELAADRLEKQHPTALVLGRDLTFPDGVQSLDVISRQFGGEGGPDLLGTLQRMSQQTGDMSMLIVDALNEANGPGQVLEDLAIIAAEHPWLMILVSRRNDSSPQVESPPPEGAALYEHQGLSVDAAWRIVQAYLGDDQVHPPWVVPDYSNPLILQLYAKVMQDKGRVESVTVTDLMHQWLELLGQQHARRSGRSLDRGELRNVLTVIDSSPTPLRYPSIVAAASGLEPEAARSALDTLLDEGVLTARTDGSIHYALQRLRELRQGEHRLRKLGLAALLPHTWERASSPEAPTQELRTLASLAPRVIHTEVLRRPSSSKRPTGTTLAFASSLQRRPRDLVSKSTLDAAKNLASHSATSPFLWFAAMINAAEHGHPLGARFMADTVMNMSKAARADKFIRPLWGILTSVSGSDRNALQEVLLWIDRGARHGRLHPDQAKDLADMLLTWLLLPNSKPVRAVARVLATVMVAYPRLIPGLIERAGKFGDHDVAAHTWAGVHGALQRTLHDTEVLHNVATALNGTQNQPGQHLPTLHYIVQILRLMPSGSTSLPPYRGLVDAAQSSVKLSPPRMFRRSEVIQEEILAQGRLDWLVDPATGHPPAAGEELQALYISLSGRRTRAPSAPGDEFERDVVVKKYAQQAADCYIARHLHELEVATSQQSSIEFGSSRNTLFVAQQRTPVPQTDRHPFTESDASLFVDHLDAGPDVTLDSMSDTPSAGGWWLPCGFVPGRSWKPPAEGRLSTDALRVVDPDQKIWWVLDARVRAMDHAIRPEPHGELIDESRWMGPLPGSPPRLRPGRRHHWLFTLTSVLTSKSNSTPNHEQACAETELPSHPGLQTSSEYGLAAALRPDPRTAWEPPVATAHDASDHSSSVNDLPWVRTPSFPLVDALGATWAGRGLDLLVGDEVIVTAPDPELTLLLISDQGLHRLSRAGLRIVGRLECLNLHALHSSPRTSTVILE